ncbi:MAG TPA: sigma-70 family RNA polymerase sigma factor [Alphaproteobacteria bacterium]
MSSQISPRYFERLALPHLDAAYNLARWLTRNDHDAEDVVQDAYLRAYKYFAGFRGENFRAWLLAVVRRAAYDWMQRNRPAELVPAADIDVEAMAGDSETDNPEASLMRQADQKMVNEMIAALPVPFREVVVMRELQELSYKEIAAIAEVPVGTVMSRLARARALLAADGRRRLKESNYG